MRDRAVRVVAIQADRVLAISKVPHPPQGLTIDRTWIGDVRSVGPLLTPNYRFAGVHSDRRRKIEHRDRFCDAGFQAIAGTERHRDVECAAVRKLIRIVVRLVEIGYRKAIAKVEDAKSIRLY